MGRIRRLVTDAQIIASYERTHSIFVTARELSIGASTVHRALRANGVVLTGLTEWRQNATKFRGQEQAIRAAYESGMTYAQLQSRFGDASIYAYKQALKRAGAVLRENPAPLIKDGELEKIQEMTDAGMGQMAISLALNRSQNFVSKVVRKNNLKSKVNMRGSKHSQWKGGRYKDHKWLRQGMDSVGRADNRPENLQLRHGQHSRGVVVVCLDCGSHNIGHRTLA